VKRFKVGNVVLCEHVVQGAGNKHTLVNVYTGDLLLQDVPGTIMLGLYVEIRPQPSIPPMIELDLRVGGKPLAAVQVSLENHDPSKPAILAIPMFPVEISEDTHLRIKLVAEGFQALTIVDRRVSKAPFPIA